MGFGVFGKKESKVQLCYVQRKINIQCLIRTLTIWSAEPQARYNCKIPIALTVQLNLSPKICVTLSIPWHTLSSCPLIELGKWQRFGLAVIFMFLHLIGVTKSSVRHFKMAHRGRAPLHFIPSRLQTSAVNVSLLFFSSFSAASVLAERSQQRAKRYTPSQEKPT